MLRELVDFDDDPPQAGRRESTSPVGVGCALSPRSTTFEKMSLARTDIAPGVAIALVITGFDHDVERCSRPAVRSPGRGKSRFVMKPSPEGRRSNKVRLALTARARVIVP
jgi:hypothetical protein